MICRNCGAEVNDGADFCPKCGQKAISNGVVAQNGLDRQEIITIVFFTVQVLMYLYQAIFVSSPAVEYYSSQAGSFANIFRVICVFICGISLIIPSVFFIIAVIKGSNKLFKVGIITGIVLSLGYISSFLLYTVFFILLLIKSKGRAISNAVLIVVNALGTVISVWFSSTWKTGEYARVSPFESYIALTVGAVAGAIAYALLVLIIDKKHGLTA